ncbi:MAG: hypothetical protein KatS3mg031_0401 [Chitinophagales bacterium]|nr:MAG: hypothetical protein KatS3mg031_0401 [Chitinophagales bacterium]
MVIFILSGLQIHFPTGRVYSWNNTPTGDSLAYVLNEPDMHTFRYLPINIDPYLIFFDKRGHKHHFKVRYYYIKTRNSNNENTNAWLGYGEYNFHSRLRIKSVIFDFVTGASFSYSSVESAIFGKRNSTNAAAFFQMDTRLFDQLTLTCGIRGEIYKLDTLPLATAEHSLSGPVIFRLGANYAILKATHIRGSFGLGYRYPSIAEKYVKTIRANQYVIPNPELKPESSWSAELGFNQGFKLASWIGYIDLAGFVTQYDDMLEFTVAPNKEKVKYYPSVPPLFVFWSENISDTRISGLEVSAMGQGKIGNVTANLLIGYTYMHPIDRNYDPFGPDSLKYQGRSNILNWRFKHTAKGDMECSYKGFMVGFTTFINSFMENIDPLIELIPGVKAYREAHHGPTYSVDARVGYSLNEQTKLTFIAKNLTNKQNSIRPAYVEAPRNYTLQLSYEF